MSAKLTSQRRISPHEGQEGGSIGPASAAASFGWRNGCASPGRGVDWCRQRSQIGNPGFSLALAFGPKWLSPFQLVPRPHPPTLYTLVPSLVGAALWPLSVARWPSRDLRQPASSHVSSPIEEVKLGCRSRKLGGMSEKSAAPQRGSLVGGQKRAVGTLRSGRCLPSSGKFVVFRRGERVQCGSRRSKSKIPAEKLKGEKP